VKIGMQLLERRTLRTKLSFGFAALHRSSARSGCRRLLTQRTLLPQINQLYEQDLLGVSNAKDAQAAYITMGGSCGRR
jgi:hypothetical protein